MKAKTKTRSTAAPLRLSSTDARALCATVIEIVALMRRAHGITTQLQLAEDHRRRVTRLPAANEERFHAE